MPVITPSRPRRISYSHPAANDAPKTPLSGGRWLMSAFIRSTSGADLFFHVAMCGNSRASSTIKSTVGGRSRAPPLVCNDHRPAGRARQRAEVVAVLVDRRAALGGIAIIASGASASARRAYSSISAVSLPCTPSTSATAFPRASSTGQHLHARACARPSSGSPRRSIPAARRCPGSRSGRRTAASRARSSQSTAPAAVNGVVRMMNAPRIGLSGLEVVGPSRHRQRRESGQRPESRAREVAAIDLRSW